MLRAAAVAVLACALVTVVLGAGAPMSWLLPLAVAVVLLVVAGGAARALGDVVNGTPLALVGVCYATTAGWLVTVAIDPVSTVEVRVVGAGSAAVVARVLSIVAVADAVLLFATP